MNLAAVALLIACAVGPSGAVLRPAMMSRGAVEGAPMAALAETVGELWLVEHDQPHWNRAFFMAADEPVGLLAAQLGPIRTRAARLLPALRVPRLFLERADYRLAGRHQSVVDLAVDVGEYLFSALLEAHLTMSTARDPALAARIAARAEELMVAEAPADRVVAYRAALVAFGGTALSVANELGRSQRRRRARGDSLCRLLDLPRSLMTHWRDSVIRGGAYPGVFERASDGQMVTSRAAIEAEDKRLVADALLGVSWTGDPRRDFPWLCAPLSAER